MPVFAPELGFKTRLSHVSLETLRISSMGRFGAIGELMNLGVGFIVAFAIIAIGGVGLAIFAIAHREKEALVDPTYERES